MPKQRQYLSQLRHVHADILGKHHDIIEYIALTAISLVTMYHPAHVEIPQVQFPAKYFLSDLKESVLTCEQRLDLSRSPISICQYPKLEFSVEETLVWRG